MARDLLGISTLLQLSMLFRSVPSQGHKTRAAVGPMLLPKGKACHADLPNAMSAFFWHLQTLGSAGDLTFTKSAVDKSLYNLSDFFLIQAENYFKPVVSLSAFLCIVGNLNTRVSLNA